MFKWYDVPKYETLEGWRLWKAKTKSAHPIQYFFRETVTSWFNVKAMQLRDIKWAILHRVHPKHRYHVIKPRSLSPGYHDPRSLILYASFDLLSEFAEKQLMGDGVKGTKWLEDDIPQKDSDDYEHVMAQIETESKIIALRNWWVDYRPHREEIHHISEPTERPAGSRGLMWMFESEFKDTPEYKAYREYLTKLNEQYDAFDKEDIDKLRELVELSPHLWY